MAVRKQITQESGLYFITFTCAGWLPLFEITNGYSAVYKWFDHLQKSGHSIVAYVIMPNHVHMLIAFRNTKQSVNTIIGNGKRFMAYELVKLLQLQGRTELLSKLASWVKYSQRIINKKHHVFEPSFDQKECRTMKFILQKVNYIHANPCRKNLVLLPEDYEHSSAGFYHKGIQGRYAVVGYWELKWLAQSPPSAGDCGEVSE